MTSFRCSCVTGRKWVLLGSILSRKESIGLLNCSWLLRTVRINKIRLPYPFTCTLSFCILYYACMTTNSSSTFAGAVYDELCEAPRRPATSLVDPTLPLGMESTWLCSGYYTYWSARQYLYQLAFYCPEYEHPCPQDW